MVFFLMNFKRGKMHIEIDQSGKIEQLNKDTYIAFSNHEQYCVKFPKKIKQEVVYEFRTRVRQIIQKLFAICIFYCLNDYTDKKELITIDLEYTGWEAFIKREVVYLIKKQYPNFDKDVLRFGIITKNSKAHKLALRTYREEEKPNKILNKEDILKWLK